MRNETLIAETGRLLAALSEEQARTVRDFAAFLAQQAWHNLPLVDDNLSADETEEEFAADIRAIQQHSRAYDFLHDESSLSEDKLEVTTQIGVA
ncbi:hypothetical protein QMK33_13900 [Hymenobacter sp. H14-R3]|uniref:hypothetical protein n=1 Tax=Hymenobacter sp. H14-R3 TaxID=3046308 RepID=UPI0024B87C03|nr:hypothetical protein [Hymenobacter sp. H14-R3]MDJ0366248.1 hypothetical protein [Hymenobacter sp. H14-R3]